LPSGKYTLAEAAGGHLVPKSTLQKYPSKLNLGKTLVNYMSRKDYPGKLLKAGWDIMGEGYTVGDKIGELGKNISKAGLGYLKNNALRALTTLGSLPAQAGLMTLYSTPLGADDMPTGDAEQEYFDYYNQYGDSYGDLKIPGWRKRKMDKLATQKGIDQVGMQQKIQQAQAAQQAAAVQQVRQNIQTYGNRDRPNVGINRPGGGRGQSPTGGDVAGTPFARGGILGAF